MRIIFFCFLLNLSCCVTVYAQRDTITSKANDSLNLSKTQAVNIPPPDSAASAKTRRENFMADSIAMIYLMPDSLRGDKFMEAIKKQQYI